MGTPPLDRSVYVAAARHISEAGGNVTNAAVAAGMSRPGFEKRARNAADLGLWGRDGQGGCWYAPEVEGAPAKPVPSATPLPDDDLPTGELIDFMVRRFEKRKAHSEAKRWRRFSVPIAGPYALMIFGDPHIDDNGCDWGTLRPCLTNRGAVRRQPRRHHQQLGGPIGPAMGGTGHVVRDRSQARQVVPER
jgi:hypothetical protein